MHKTFARWGWRRRVVALAAAYLLVLSGLIASFGAVRTAIADATSSDVVICQRPQLGQPAPGGDHGDCNSSCCVGCLALMAALPPPPDMAIAIERTPGRVLPPPAEAERRFDPHTRSHQSRAPPRAA